MSCGGGSGGSISVQLAKKGEEEEDEHASEEDAAGDITEAGADEVSAEGLMPRVVNKSANAVY